MTSPGFQGIGGNDWPVSIVKTPCAGVGFEVISAVFGPGCFKVGSNITMLDFVDSCVAISPLPVNSVDPVNGAEVDDRLRRNHAWRLVCLRDGGQSRYEENTKNPGGNSRVRFHTMVICRRILSALTTPQAPTART
jgi:hypothetical protein